MGKFNFFTMGLFVIIAYMTTFLVKRAEQYVLYKHGVKKYAAQGKCLYMCAYLVQIFFCVIHNVDMYPKYPSENTIDMQAYIYFFQEGLTAGWDWKKIITFNQWEPLFYSINLFIRLFTSNYRIYWFILYSIYVICLLVFTSQFFDNIRTFCIYPFFIVQLLYGMCALRNCMANAFCLLAFCFLKKEKNALFILMVILAMGCHYTAVFVLPAIIAVECGKKLGNYRREKLLTIVVIATVVANIAIPIAKIEILQTKYSVYLGQKMTLLGQMYMVCCAAAGILFLNDMKKKYPELDFLVYIVAYNCILTPLIMEFNIYRINDYFMLPRLMVWSMVIECLQDKVKGQNSKKLVAIIGGFVMFMWMIKNVYDMQGYGIMPYLNYYI